MSTLIVSEKELIGQTIKQAILKDYKVKTLAEIADDLLVSLPLVRSHYIWLLKSNEVNATELKRPEAKVPTKKYKPRTTKTEYVEVKATKKRGRPSNAEKLQQFNDCTIGTVNIYNGITAEIDNTIGNYKNANGVKKQQAREVMIGYINESNVVGIIPTLTNTETVIEEAILAEHPNMQFIAVEREKPVYLKLKKILKAKNKQYGVAFDHHFGSMSDMIHGKDSDTYGHLLLDYCGCLPTFAREIKTAIDNNVVKVGGIIAVTYNRANRKGKGEYFDYIRSLKPKSNNANDSRKDSDIENENFFAEITGRNYRVREFFYYRDKNAMALCIIQRVK